MTVRTVSRYEQDQAKIVDTVNQLASGRSNATGTVTLSSAVSNSLTSTVVGTSTSTSVPIAPTCAAGSGVWLFPTTANAASSGVSAYVASTDVTKGRFIIHHSSSTTTDRIFNWLVQG